MQKEIVRDRNDQEITEALGVMAQVMAQANTTLQANQNQNGGDDEFYGLEKFYRHNPPTFKERYDPEGAWLDFQRLGRFS